MADRIPMTPRGAQALRNDLKRLLEIERPKNLRDIEEARAHGDLSENAEYHAAKEQQGFIEGRLRKIEHMLAVAEIIDPGTLRGDRVVFGATVTLEDAENGAQITYSILGDHESDIKQGRIAVSAPIARALIGHQVGESVSIRSGKGFREYRIQAVRFEPQQ